MHDVDQHTEHCLVKACLYGGAGGDTDNKKSRPSRRNQSEAPCNGYVHSG
uniref:Uncharacterized protein n=1 Tax=Arion vulgaris TaxID=1028688 RepID=A0A0B7AQV0_9EUPU